MKKLIKLTIPFLVFVLGLRPTFPAFAADLTIDLGVPSGQPILTVENMLPGDTETRTVKITNTASSPRLAAVKSLKTEETKDFSQILDITIKANGADIYGGTTGAKTLANFFSVSNPDPLPLTLIPAGQTVSYDFSVRFPSSAGNGYQKAKVVFDLIFGSPTADHLVINEVFYNVDTAHGNDCANICPNLVAKISGNGAGSTNLIDIKFQNACIIVQKNNAVLQNSVIANANTGNSTIIKTSGGSITTGNSAVNISITNLVNFSFGSCAGVRPGQYDEWIEIYNPTASDISLKNWVLEDNSGIQTKITANKKVKAGGFALISKDASTWRFWNVPKSTLLVEIGSPIGNGLDNDDHLFLKNSTGQTVDAVGWGTDTAVWNPAVPQVPPGFSIERLFPGFDTNLPSDWETQTPPTPGN